VTVTVPCPGVPTAVTSSGALPVSFARTSTSAGCPDVAVVVSGESASVAGAATVTATVAVSVPPLPSETVYVNESEPVQPLSGVYWTRVPPVVTAVLPCAGVDAAVTVSGSFSGSVSLPSTAKEAATSWVPVTVSSTASGASLTCTSTAAGSSVTSDTEASMVAAPTRATTELRWSPGVAGRVSVYARTLPEAPTVKGPGKVSTPPLSTPSAAGSPRQVTEPLTRDAPVGTVSAKSSRTAPAEPDTVTS
jgi:hypothetical protein